MTLMSCQGLSHTVPLGFHRYGPCPSSHWMKRWEQWWYTDIDTLRLTPSKDHSLLIDECSPLFLSCELSMCPVLAVCFGKVFVPFVSRVFEMFTENCCVGSPASPCVNSQTWAGILLWSSGPFVVGQEISGADCKTKIQCTDLLFAKYRIAFIRTHLSNPNIKCWLVQHMFNGRLK